MKKSEILLEYFEKIFPVSSNVEIRDANNRPFSVVGKIKFRVQIDMKKASSHFTW